MLGKYRLAGIVFLALALFGCSTPRPTLPMAPAAQRTQAPTVAVPDRSTGETRRQLVPGFAVDAALLEAAKKEGKVVFWSGLTEDDVFKTAAKFTDLTGIEVKATRLSAGPIVTRLNRERDAGLYTVDVINHGDPATWQAYKAKKQIVPYTPEGTKKYPSEVKDKDGMFFANDYGAYGIGYNTRLITGNAVPERIADLVDPKYKGKIAMTHPKFAGSSVEVFATIVDLLGWQYFEKLKTNDLLLVRSATELNPLAISGERPISVVASDTLFIGDKNAGQPVDFVYPEEGTPMTNIFTAIVADAPHPNAAKLFQEWLHSAAQQNLLTANFYLVPHPDAVYPTGRKKLSELKPLFSPIDTDITKRYTTTVERFTDLFGS